MSVRSVPEGYHTVTPYLIISGAALAIEYYKQAFGAAEIMRVEGPDGRIGHAEIQIGDSRIMLGDEHPEAGIKSPQSIGGNPVGLCLYVENVDEVFDRAVKSGGKVERPLSNQFYGDRSGTILDPFGHKWTISSHIEDVPPEEIERRVAAMQKGG